VWSAQTTDPVKVAYSITAAPTIAGDKVVIGNSGSEYGVRGYVTAYDAETGKQVWRFLHRAGDPRKGFESKAMEIAARRGTARTGGKPAAEGRRGKA
jgi:quinohemoprotein ethanol dehydrogenase